jgi:hypothetical protein
LKSASVAWNSITTSDVCKLEHTQQFSWSCWERYIASEGFYLKLCPFVLISGSVYRLHQLIELLIAGERWPVPFCVKVDNLQVVPDEHCAGLEQLPKYTESCNTHCILK